jgi:hypothetical protein
VLAKDVFKINEHKHGAHASAMSSKDAKSKEYIRASGKNVKPTIVRAVQCNALPDDCRSCGFPGVRCGGYRTVSIFMGINIKISMMEPIHGKRDSKVRMI